MENEEYEKITPLYSITGPSLLWLSSFLRLHTFNKLCRSMPVPVFNNRVKRKDFCDVSSFNPFLLFPFLLIIKDLEGGSVALRSFCVLSNDDVIANSQLASFIVLLRTTSHDSWIHQRLNKGTRESNPHVAAHPLLPRFACCECVCVEKFDPVERDLQLVVEVPLVKSVSARAHPFLH